MIKNIVFDVGNVLVVWDPASVVAKIFPDENTEELTKAIFKSDLWFDLNLGRLTIPEAIKRYERTLGFEVTILDHLLDEVKKSLLPIPESFLLLNQLHEAKYSLFALTDNIREFMVYLQATYDFWPKFKGIVVSAEVGFLKPAPEIYDFLLKKFALNAKETLFIDDLLPNILGAKRLGMQGIQFINTSQCILEMKKLNVAL